MLACFAPRMPSTSRTLAWALAFVVTGGCRPRTPTVAPEPPPGAITTDGALEPVLCGPEHLRLDDYAWAPAYSRVLASLALDDPELGAALVRLGQALDEPRHAFPIELAFGLRQWSWQVPLLRATLDEAGFRPAELAYVRTEDATVAWVFASRCDFELARTRVAAAWDVDVRRTLEAAIGSPRSGSTFAFDVVFLEGERMALVPTGQGSRFVRALHDPRSFEPEPSPTLAESLAALEHGPLRLLVRAGPRGQQGRGSFLDPDAPSDGAPVRSFVDDGHALHDR